MFICLSPMTKCSHFLSGIQNPTSPRTIYQVSGIFISVRFCMGSFYMTCCFLFPRDRDDWSGIGQGLICNSIRTVFDRQVYQQARVDVAKEYNFKSSQG